METTLSHNPENDGKRYLPKNMATVNIPNSRTASVVINLSPNNGIGTKHLDVFVFHLGKTWKQISRLTSHHTYEIGKIQNFSILDTTNMGDMAFQDVDLQVKSYIIYSNHLLKYRGANNLLMLILA